MMDYNKAVQRETQIHYLRSDVEPSEEVKNIDKELAQNKANPQLWMKRGLALAKQQLFREAVESFSEGLSYDPFNWELYRHRGHRFLSTYRFKEAQADFELASRLNPQSWDTLYHLGLSYYLNGDLERANNAYNHCLEITCDKDSHLFAILNWKYITLMRLGRKEEAMKVLDRFVMDTDGGPDQNYKDMVMIYKGMLKPEDIPDFCKDGIIDATRGYGVGMNLYLTGHKEEGLEMLNKIYNEHSYWAAFGYLAVYNDMMHGRL